MCRSTHKEKSSNKEFDEFHDNVPGSRVKCVMRNDAWRTNDGDN